MHHLAVSTALVGLLAGFTTAQNREWQQCGGQNWSGDTTCVSGYGCVKVNDYYHQCQPGAAPAPTTTNIDVPSPTSTDPGTPSTTGTPSGTGPGTELQSGYYWIRAVASPNFHKYMQSKPLYATGPAILGSHTTAGQFQVVDGQLVQLVSAAGAKPEKFLYGVVSEVTYNNNQSRLVTFSESKNTYGTWGWQGDGLTWDVAGTKRPNSIAWYVCKDQVMYINLGAYLYQTPAGCVDQTIHYYNDKKAND